MIGPFWIGDVPADVATINVYENDEPADLSTFTGAHGALIAPDGTSTELTCTIVGSDVQVSFGDTSLFTIEGVYTLTVALTSDTAWQNLPPESIIAQAVNGWVSIGRARELWADAPDDDEQLFELLDAARTACIDYAPALPVDDTGAVVLPLPAGYRNAQLMQARNTWNAAKTDPSVTGDGDMFVIRPYPLDNFIKQLLRPRRGVPVVG